MQITVAESIGVEGRGRFYEKAGALRDMVQNHMLQVLALVAMEPPASFDAEAVRDEKVKVLRRGAADDARATSVRGQYAAGFVDGERGARLPEEEGVAPDSDDRDLRRRARLASTTGAGPACRSTCAPASACRSA